LYCSYSIRMANRSRLTSAVTEAAFKHCGCFVR